MLMIMETLGKRLKAVRTAQGLSQKQLALMAGYKGQSAISNIENGEQVGSTKVSKIASVLRVDPYWLETGKGDKPQDTQLGAKETLRPYEAGLHLSAEEKQLILDYRLLTRTERTEILGKIKARVQHNAAVLEELGKLKNKP